MALNINEFPYIIILSHNDLKKIVLGKLFCDLPQENKIIKYFITLQNNNIATFDTNKIAIIFLGKITKTQHVISKPQKKHHTFFCHTQKTFHDTYH